MSNQKFKHIAIIGLGLIGSSLARALRRKHKKLLITGYNRNPDVTREALKLGIITHSAKTPKEAAKKADIIIICTPLGTYAALAAQIAPAMQAGAILTDAGSTKLAAIRDISAHLSEEQLPFFIPGHPIAGSEKSGLHASSATLYDKKRVILTPLPKADKDAVQKVKTMWRDAGATIKTLDAATHDTIYAAVSHVPHVIAFSYALALQTQGHTIQEAVAHHANAAFWDFLRVGGSSPNRVDGYIHGQPRTYFGEMQKLRTSLKAVSATKISKVTHEAAAHCNALIANGTAHPAPRFKDDAAYASGWIVPVITSALILAQASDYCDYAGTGLRSLCAPLVGLPESFAKDMTSYKAAIATSIASLDHALAGLVNCLEDNDTDAIYAQLCACNSAYNQLQSLRK